MPFNKGCLLKKRTGFGSLYSLCMALFGLFKDIFEIPRVLAIWRHQKIPNRANIDRATAQNVKVIKISFGRFLKLRKKVWLVIQPLHGLLWPYWGHFWNPQGLSFLQTPKNPKLGRNWLRYSPKCKSCQNWLGQIFEKNEKSYLLNCQTNFWQLLRFGL